MNSHARWIRPFVPRSLNAWSIAAAVSLLAATATTTMAQQPAQTGSIAGRVTDESGNGVVGADVLIENTTVGGRTRTGGEYIIEQVPAGPQSVRVRMIGFRAVTASVVITPGTRASQDFSLRRDPLELQEVVTTGTQTPRVNIDASVAATTLTNAEIQQAAPRSTTEMLRYVPGFTRIESSGGEVNENITMRGILGVEYVMFMEDGLPVYPTMHTFFMNADNLFRFDENIERMEVVRGGASALFGSNTPGAIINFMNKTGGDQFGGSARITGGTEGLARFDLNANGPLGDDWRFNVGGFYRYDHGVRDPGFPGIRGGQFKGSVTRLLSNGYLRASVKVIDDRNQFILDLPFVNPSDPQYVSGFGDYGSFNTGEAINLRVPTPVGDLNLPLENGLRTQAQWYTADAVFDLDKNWRLQNTGQYMQDHQEWNALVPSNALPASDYATAAKGQGGLGLPAGTTLQLTYTNVLDASGKVHLPFSTANGLVAPGQLIHVDKPLSAFQDQLQLRRAFGKSAATVGVYFANYTQDNHWYFTQILTDVADQTHFLDAVATPPGGPVDSVTKNGFTNQLSGYTNGSGQTTVISGVIGAELQITDRLRADIGLRGEYDKFVQTAENTSTFDLDLNPLTTFNNETFGNGSFRHFERGIDDWAASLGLNFTLKPNLALYASGTRGYKMPALDEFLNATAQQQADLFQSKEVQGFEGGIKGQLGAIGFTVGGFWTKLKDIVSQGLVIDPVTGASSWIIVPSPENKSYGTEIELVANVYRGLQFFGNATILKAELGTGAGADIGSRINGVPTSIANAAAVYTAPGGFFLKADWHWVDSRPVDVSAGVSLPSYNYFNFGAGYTLGGGTTINVDLLNAFQSKGLEEGNPRLVSTGPVFLARPILPRRLTASIKYDFGGGRRQTVTVPQP